MSISLELLDTFYWNYIKKSHFHEPINYHSSYQCMENEGYFSFSTIKMSPPILNAHSLTIRPLRCIYIYTILKSLLLCIYVTISTSSSFLQSFICFSNEINTSGKTCKVSLNFESKPAFQKLVKEKIFFETGSKSAGDAFFGETCHHRAKKDTQNSGANQSG
jgi:hypothetical protein